MSFTARGFWGSGGQIDIAGPRDVADASTVVDWLLAHTSTDRHTSEMADAAYGAGIGLLTAAHDQRVRMSGWTHLVESLYGNGTRRPQAVAELTGRPSAEQDEMLDDYSANCNVSAVIAWGRVRSPSTFGRPQRQPAGGPAGQRVRGQPVRTEPARRLLQR
jgi:hypothetical protein